MKKLLLIIGLIATTSAPASSQLFYEIFGHNKTKKDLKLVEGSHYEVTVQTSEGNITMMLFNETPKHRDNFAKLIRSGFYTGVLFHRVVSDFMIQAGDPSSREGSEVRTYGGNDVGYKIDAEILPQFYHKKGALAAARDENSVNPTKQSSGSQFYIVVGQILTNETIEDAKEKTKFHNSTEITPEREKTYRTIGGAPHLDGNYTIFGEVVKGQKIVDRISNIPTYKNARPKKDVYIKKATIEVVADKKRR